MVAMSMSFPAVRGTQGRRNYYVGMFPLNIIPRLFEFAEHGDLPPEQRAQRVLNRKRVPEIAKYILEHEEGWVFSSLTASFDGDESFEPSQISDNIGLLHLSLGTKFLINDGQHRRAAIEEALKVNPSLGTETISVVLFQREDLERDQQIFSDLNRTVQKTSRSLDILYDHRDPMNSLALEVGERVSVFRGRVEKDQVSLSLRSAKFVTLSSLYDANVQLLGKLPEKAEEDEIGSKTETAIRYWDRVTKHIPDWQNIAAHNVLPKDIRAESITSSAVVLWALGSAGRELMGAFPNDWEQRLAHLDDIDWRKTNKDWQGITMLGNDVVTRRQTKETTAKYIKWKLGLLPSKPERVLAS
jgi:DNA sulfur modification protein DndB